MSLTAAQAGEINKESPTLEKYAIGTRIRESELYSPVILSVDITSDSHTTAASFAAAPCAFEIVDVIVQARATSTDGTATLRTGTNAISDAIIMATDTAITRAGTLNDARTTIAAGTVLNVITHGAGDKGLITVIGRRTA